MEASKKDFALVFLNELARIQPERLQEVIRLVVGEDLAAALFNYAHQVIDADPGKMHENASSLIILGYLIRAYETGDIPAEDPPA